MVGSAIAAVPVLAAAGLPARHPDADLIAAYAAFVAYDRGLIQTEDDEETDEQRDAAYDRWCGLFESVIGTRARTPEGLAVLALAALRESAVLESIEGILAWGGYDRPNRIEDGTRTDRLLWNIVESARAMAGREARR